jgi:hypothetical protein
MNPEQRNFHTAAMLHQHKGEVGMQDQNQFQHGGLEAIFDFGFSKFITLNVMRVLYALGLLVIALFWLIMVITSFTQGAVQGLLALIVGTIVALLYVIFYRVWLELIVVIFRIGENTSRMVRDRSDTQPDTPPTEN